MRGWWGARLPVLVAAAVVLAVPVGVAAGVHARTAASGSRPQAAGPVATTSSPAGGDGLWRGSPALWQPPPIPLTGGYLADIQRYDVTGATEAELIASLDRGPTGRLGWGTAELRPDPFACYPVIKPFVSLKYGVVVRLPRWSPPSDASVTVDLVERWNALQRSIYTRLAGYVRVYAADMDAILALVGMLPNCASVIAYLNDPYTWQKVDDDRGAYERKVQADCRPEAGCQPPGWMGW